MDKVYKIKNLSEETVKKFEENGYCMFPGTQTIAKIIKQEIDKSDLPQQFLDAYYNNPEWKKKFYNTHKKLVKEQLGLQYKAGEIKMTKKFQKILENWRIQIDLADDPWLGFTSADPFDQRVFFNVAVLDKYCEEEIKSLKEQDLIEELSV